MFREQEGQPIKGWFVYASELPTSSNGYNVNYTIREASEKEATQQRDYTLSRQKIFNSVLLPAIPVLTEEQVEVVKAHNAVQRAERKGNEVTAEITEAAQQEATLPFELLPGIVYIHPSTPQVKKLRKLSEQSRTHFLKRQTGAEQSIP